MKALVNILQILDENLKIFWFNKNLQTSGLEESDERNKVCKTAYILETIKNLARFLENKLAILE
jgi:hypothetical protein